MKTKRFCELVELAMKEAYDQESAFDTVPYIPEDGGEMRECLGIFILPDQQMTVVAAQAMKMIFDDAPAETASDDMSHFVVLMHGMLVAPYMQWYCAYFPDLTAEQVLAESEAGDSVDARLGVELAGDAFGDVPAGTDAGEHNDDLLADDARDVCIELRECAKIEGVDLSRCIAYVHGHMADVCSMRDNGMKISEVADTVRSLVNVNSSN